jgi:hypothetical protein
LSERPQLRRAQSLGRYAAVTQFVFAGVLGGFASLHFEPVAIPRGPVLLGVFLLPGAIGWIGADRRRPALVAAAALTSGVGAFIAFSGVTLIFLLASMLFLTSALGLAFPAPGEPRGGLGSGTTQLVLAVAIAGLTLGAGASALLITDSACWITYETAEGRHTEPLPYSTGGMTLAGDATSGGCSTGLMSLRGVGLGAALAGAALGLTVRAGRRRDAASPPASRPAEQVAAR